MPKSGWGRVNVALKVLLVVLIAVALAFGNAERFNDKAMSARAVAYPLLCAVPALLWWLANRRRTVAYPHGADALVTLAFVIDLGGNALDLFDRYSWFDDAAHFTNWALLGAALSIALLPGRARWEVVWMATGAGAVLAVGWELAEYSSFVLTVEQVSIYRDTIGDLCLGTLGAFLASLLVVNWR
jgi:hypothetical protein